jgi:DNA polymerase-3 subunit delta
MAKPLDALDFLAHPEKHPAPGVVVLFGDEAFLKRQALAALKQQVLAGEDADFSVNVFTGKQCTLRDLNDALATRALFGGGQQLVIVEDADEFVTQNRAALESFVGRTRTASVLVLDVKQWASNTRLYKVVAETGLQIECKFPAPARLLKWLAAQARVIHRAQLDPDAAEVLADTVESELGLFDQELAKLAALAGPDAKITADMVHEAVGGWRAKSAWEMLDAMLGGDARSALVQLDHLLQGGEVPIALLAQIGSSLRRLAAAARLIEHGELTRRPLNLRQALEHAGVKPFLIGKVEPQLRRLGRTRAGQLYRWLLEADLALKGVSSSPARARLVLETLVVRIASAPATQATAHARG